ncbi:MAG: alpha/beta hydrolase [Chloroflexota bacterium]
MYKENVTTKDAKIRLSDGQVHYQEAGEGTPLLLLHSLGSSVFSWAKVVRPLAQKHTVYALDTMGQGDSDKPSRDYAIEDYGGSVIEFMKSMNIDKATLIGNSIGASIASEVSASNPHLVNKLVLVGCPFRETEEERREALELSKAQYDAAANPLPRSLDDLKQTYFHVSEELQKRVNAERAKAGVWCWKAMLALNKYDPTAVVGKISCPTLLIFGDKDMLRAKEEALKGRIRGSKLVIIPSAGHVPQVDNPEAFLDAVLPFVG